MHSASVSLNECARRALAAVSGVRPVGVRLRVVTDPQTPSVMINAERIEQIILNLVRNAFDAVEGHGTVSIATSRHPDGGASLSVTDDGPGVPPDVRQHLFTPFFTTKKEGNGLGLAICSQIVTDCGGRISFSSPPAGGATFTIAFPPIVQSPAAPCEPAGRAAEAAATA